jgi:hypothetical protein
MRRANKARIPAEWVDEIPTNPSAYKARVVAIAVFMLGTLGLGAFLIVHGLPALALITGPAVLQAFAEHNPGLAKLGVMPLAAWAFRAFGLLGVYYVLTGLLGLKRSPMSYRLLRHGLYGTFIAVGFYVWVVWHGVFGALGEGIDINGSVQDKITSLKLCWDLCWPALAIAAYAAWLHMMLRSRSVYAAFTRQIGDPMDGDLVLEDIRTHGRDPRQRRSFYASALTHITVLVIIPYIMSLGGCVDAYKVPKGSGNPVVAMVKMVKPKKKKKKTLSLRPNSAILFEIPDLDDTLVDQQMEEQTQATYQASNNAKAGKMGKGGGTKGGWPAGMENYKIRFIRLEHSGAGWDDGMDQTDADINFLRAFAQATGFKKIASKGESHSIALLKKYPDDGFPPFVYLTGNSDMGRVSSADMKILRDYCLNGGMLIADAGSARFHQSFTHLMGQVFPDKQLIDIADDDMLYQLPYSFPDGAPAFWHHGGRRALGIKHEGRWIAFYHPGDMNDAWKAQGYSDVTPEMREQAMNLGINLVYYAFGQWNDAIAKLKK